MGLINELYKPTHVLMPMGEQCSLGAFDAAYVCKQFLTNCQTLIPMFFRSNEQMSDLHVTVRQLSSDTFLEPVYQPPSLLTQFKTELD